MVAITWRRGNQATLIYLIVPTCLVSPSNSMICSVRELSMAADSLSNAFSCSIPLRVVTFCVESSFISAWEQNGRYCLIYFENAWNIQVFYISLLMCMQLHNFALSVNTLLRGIASYQKARCHIAVQSFSTLHQCAPQS